MLQRTSIPVVLLMALAAAACSSGGSPQLSISFGAGSASANVPPGKSTTINLTAESINGYNATPIVGTVTLTVTPSIGTLAASTTTPTATCTNSSTNSSCTVPLNSDGTASVNFTMCSSGSMCTPGTELTVAASMVTNGQTLIATPGIITVGSDIVLSIVANPAVPHNDVKPGQMVTLEFAACNTGGAAVPDGGLCSGAPVPGTVTFAIDGGTVNGTLDVTSLALNEPDAGTADGGTDTAIFTVCSATETGCTNDAAATVTATFKPAAAGSSPVSKSISFNIVNTTVVEADGGDAGSAVASNGDYALSLTITNANGTPFDGRVPAGGSQLALVGTLTGAVVAGKTVTLGVTGGIGTLTAETLIDGGTLDAGTTIGPDAGLDGGQYSVLTVQATTNANGDFYALFASADTGEPLQGDITATFIDPMSTTPLQAQQIVTVVVPGEILFTPNMMTFTQLMGVEYSGFNETDQFDFTLLDSTGAAYTTPVNMHFSLPGSTGGSATGLGGSRVSPTDIFTDTTGQASTTVYSGTTAGTFAVTASANITLGTHTFALQVTSSTVAVVGAKASGRNISISCDHYSVPALIGNDCTYMHVDVTPTCTAVIGDRFGNVLGVADQVTWLSEAGFFGPPSSTSAATPGADPTSEPTLGQTSNALYMLNAPLPEHVTPCTKSTPGTNCLIDEPSQVLGNNPCSTLTGSPRDGLVTFIAATQGEEGFVDLNDNGQWDPGEPFFDQGEPYVDSNDNNVHDEGEPWIDVNGNGVYDGPNGIWDQNTTIWTESHVVVTGQAGQAPGAIYWDPYPPVTTVSYGTSQAFDATWVDQNLNDPSPTYSTYSVSLVPPAAGSVNLTSPSSLVDDLGQMSVYMPSTCVTQPPGNSRSTVCAPQTPNEADGGLMPITCTTPSDCPSEAPSCVQAGSSSYCMASCYCTLSSSINFNGTKLTPNSAQNSTVGWADEQFTYTAPTMAPATSQTYDTLQPTLTELVGTNTITTNETQTVSWVNGAGGGGNGVDGGTVTSTAGEYGLTLTLTNADGSTFTGKVSAGGLPFFVSVNLTKNGAPVSMGSVAVSLTGGIGALAVEQTDGGIGASTTMANVTTNAQGVANLLLTPEDTGAADGDVVAVFSIGSVTIQVQQPVTVVVPGAIVFTPATTDNFYTIMGVKGSGYREQNTLRFTIYDSTGQPYTAGANVQFTVTQLGGATVSPTDIITDQSGQVVTIAYSGTSAGTLAVTATTSIQISANTTITLTTTSETVAVVGAKAFGRNFSFSCSAESVPALVGNDCTYMHVDVSPTCTAVIGDRYGNVLGVATEVTWLAEAGLFGPPSSTTAATPGLDPTTEPDLGRTANTLRMLDAPLPEEVTPVGGEPFQTLNADSECGTRTASPRDGLVTIIAATQGEEGFIDINDNGQWDPGEPFFDEGEPYVDSNDNNQWDPGEPWIDANGNGVYDGPNGVWDSNTTIWTEGHMMLTGSGGWEAQWYYDSGGSLQEWTAGSAVALTFGQSLNFDVFWRDQNMNPPSSLSSTYSLQLLSPATGTVVLDSPANWVDSFGVMSVTEPTSCTDAAPAVTQCGDTTCDTTASATPVCDVATTDGAACCSTAAADCPSNATCTAQTSGCNLCLTNCYCTVSTHLTFDGQVPQGFTDEVGTYTAPPASTETDAGMMVSTPGGSDTIEASVTETVGGSTIIPQDTRTVTY